MDESTHEVENFALDHEVVESIHDLLNGRFEVPRVNIEYVDIGGAELLQAVLDAIPHRFETVPVMSSTSDRVRWKMIVVRVLRSDEDLRANAASFSPFADDGLRGPILAIGEGILETTLTSRGDCSLKVGSVDQVTTTLPEGVEELEAHLLRHFAHTHLGPRGGIPNTHPSELEGRGMDAGALGKLAKVAKGSWRCSRRYKAGHCW